MSTVIGDLKRLSMSRKDRPIRRVKQLSGTSCGIACVAMLARLSYRDAMRCAEDLWGSKDEWDSHRTDAAELREMLEALGWELGNRVNCEDWSKVPEACLAVVQQKKTKAGSLVWHWVVGVRGRSGTVVVLDPRESVKANKRSDLSRIKLSAYHHVW